MSSSPQISRKDFLKFLAAGAAIAVVGSFHDKLLLFSPSSSKSENAGSSQGGTKEAFAQLSGGSWKAGPTVHATPVHAALLRNGKILFLAGSGYYDPNRAGPFQAGVIDPSSNTVTKLPNMNEDLFCCGFAQLDDGNILMAGGSLIYNTDAPNGKWHGLNSAYIFNPSSNGIQKIQSMKHGRWYPTMVVLPDKTVLTVAGYDEFGAHNRLPEIYDPSSKTWKIKYDPQSDLRYCAGEGENPQIVPGAGKSCYGPGVVPSLILYPRMHLMPSGLVAVSGQSRTLRTWDPKTGIWYWAGNMNFSGARGYGTSVLLPLQNTAAEKGKILLVGGTATADDVATTHAEILEPSGFSLKPRKIAPSKYGRKHPIAVTLPNGKIMVIGGTGFQNSFAQRIMVAEVFDPVTEGWTTISEPMSVPRMYHSVGLLLADGRVWTGGTTYGLTSRELRTEYYSPEYYSSENRPVISQVSSVGGYGGEIALGTPDAAEINAVSLVRLGAMTHAFNSDERLIWLQIKSKTSTGIIASAPINANIAPPGYYLIHVLKSGIPSVAKIIQIPGNDGSTSTAGGSGGYTTIYSVVANNSFATLSKGGTTNVTRVGEVVNANSSIVGEFIQRVTLIIKKAGNPTGDVKVVGRRGSDDSIALTFGTVGASQLGTAEQNITLTSSSAYKLAAKDKILVEWAGTGSDNDKVLVKRKGDGDGFDGANTHFVHYNGSSYVNSSARDLAGTWQSPS